MKEYNRVEAERTARDLLGAPRDFVFAMVTDSHLDDNSAETAECIARVDEEAGFECLMHMGDMLNGGMEWKWSMRLMKEQMELFRSAVDGGFYPAQGNHDGYCDSQGGDLITDEFYREAADFLLNDPRVTLPGKRPYYYVDFAEKKIRLIVLSMFDCRRTEKGWAHFQGMDAEQVDWLRDVALDLDSGWTVMLFSHDAPFMVYTEEALTAEGKAHSPRALQAVIDRRAERGFAVPAWFVGHVHGDWMGKVCGVNVILVGCATDYVPQLWDMPEGGAFALRTPGTVSENLWDAAALDMRNRKIRLFRCGAGEDRVMDY